MKFSSKNDVVSVQAENLSEALELWSLYHGKAKQEPVAVEEKRVEPLLKKEAKVQHRDRKQCVLCGKKVRGVTSHLNAAHTPEGVERIKRLVEAKMNARRKAKEEPTLAKYAATWKGY